jgi:hypothetical protein
MPLVQIAEPIDSLSPWDATIKMEYGAKFNCIRDINRDAMNALNRGQTPIEQELALCSAKAPQYIQV